MRDRCHPDVEGLGRPGRVSVAMMPHLLSEACSLPFMKTASLPLSTPAPTLMTWSTAVGDVLSVPSKGRRPSKASTESDAMCWPQRVLRAGMPSGPRKVPLRPDVNLARLVDRELRDGPG